MQELSGSGTTSAMQRVAELRTAGVDVIDLTAGDPDFPTPDYIKEGARRAIEEDFTHYTSVAGLSELREAVAVKYRCEYGVRVRTDEVLITCGGKQALFSLALSLLDEGDEVILLRPFWPTYLALTKLVGAKPRILTTREAEGFRVEVPKVEELISSRTRAVVLNFPSNPTGALIDLDDLEAIIDKALAHDIYVISDESYEKILFDRKPISAALFRRKNVVVVGSFSKNYAMTGWRVGYVIGTKELIHNLAVIQSHSVTHPCSIAQKAALTALTGDQGRVDNMVREYRRRRDRVVGKLNRIPGVRCHMPEGGFYAFPNVSAFLHGNSEVLTERLLEDGVAVVPGTAFGYDGFIRVSLSHQLEKVERGVDRIAETLARLNPDPDPSNTSALPVK